MKHGLIVDRIRAKSWREASGREVLADRGWWLTVVTDRPGPGHRDPGPYTEVIVVPSLTDESIRATVTRAHRDRPLSAISTTSELFLESLASLRDDLGLAGPGSSYTDALRDKWAMKKIAQRHGIPHAEGVLGSDVQAVHELLDRAGRCVIKPRRLSGSRGVHVVDGQADLTEWLDRCLDPSDHLVESFVDGALLHADGVVVDGLMTWQLSRYERPTHLAGGDTPLSSCTVDDSALLRRAADFLSRVASAWSLANEVFHCEMFDIGDSLVLCEIAGRPGGAGVTDVFTATRGVNLRHAKTCLDFGEGVRRAAAPESLRRAGGWTVFYASGGRFLGVDDSGLGLHHSREIRAHRNDVVGASVFAGAGIATYVFLGDSSDAVRAAVGRYEREVRVLEATADHDGHQ